MSGLAFSLRQGEVAALVGPSGCGKTTLLRIIVGLDHDFEGRVELPARSLTRRGTTATFRVSVSPPAELRGKTLTLEMQMLVENHVRFGDLWRKRVTFV